MIVQTGIGITLHSSDGVLLYGRDNPDFLDVDMTSERLKELMMNDEKRNKHTNTLYVSKRESQKPPKGILPNVVEIIGVGLSDVEESAA